MAEASQADVLKRFRELFVFRDDSLIRFADGAWAAERARVTDGVLLDHLTRRACIGLSPLNRGHVKWAAIDFGLHGVGTDEGIRDDVFLTRESFRRAGTATHIARSGRGYHVWSFFEEPVPADPVRQIWADLVVGEHEVYADSRCIRLPLGRYNGRQDFFCCFLDDAFEPAPDQRDYLVNAIVPTGVDSLQLAYEEWMNERTREQPTDEP